MGWGGGGGRETTACFHGNANQFSLSGTRFDLINVGWRTERFQKLPVVPETPSIGAAIYQIQVGASPPVPVSRAKSSERTNGRRKLVGRKRRGLRAKGGTICNYVSFHSICAGNLSPGPPSRYIPAVFAASFTLYFTYVFPPSCAPSPPSVLFLIVFVTEHGRCWKRIFRHRRHFRYLCTDSAAAAAPVQSLGRIPCNPREISRNLRNARAGSRSLKIQSAAADPYLSGESAVAFG